MLFLFKCVKDNYYKMSSHKQTFSLLQISEWPSHLPLPKTSFMQQTWLASSAFLYCGCGSLPVSCFWYEPKIGYQPPTSDSKHCCLPTKLAAPIWRHSSTTRTTISQDTSTHDANINRPQLLVRLLIRKVTQTQEHSRDTNIFLNWLLFHKDHIPWINVMKGNIYIMELTWPHFINSCIV